MSDTGEHVSGKYQVLPLYILVVALCVCGLFGTFGTGLFVLVKWGKGLVKTFTPKAGSLCVWIMIFANVVCDSAALNYNIN